MTMMVILVLNISVRRDVKKRDIQLICVLGCVCLGNVLNKFIVILRKLSYFQINQSWDQYKIKTRSNSKNVGLIQNKPQIPKLSPESSPNDIYNIMLQNINSISLLLHLAISILPISAIIYTSPFDYSIYPPSNMYRLTYTSVLTGTSKIFTVAYPSSPFNVTPQVLYSVTSMAFSNGVYYNLSLTTITMTSLTARILYDTTINKIGLSFLVIDLNLYSLSLSHFEYVMPIGTNTPQDISIANHANHDASFMVGLKITLGTMPSGYAPQADSVVVLDTTSIISTNLTISYDPMQLYIEALSIYFVDFNIASFKAPNGRPYGQQFAIYGTNGITTDQLQTNSYLSMYSNNYFMGLQTIYDAQFIFSSLNFDANNYLTSNVYYYISQLLIVSYHCPGWFPVTDSTRSYCYSQCEIGFYSDSQAICRVCDSNCYTCFGKATNCTSCVSPYILTYGFVCSCNQQTYEDTSNGSIVCIPCRTVITGCDQCSSDTNCVKCMNNLILNDPLTCACQVNTTMLTIGNSLFCVNDIPFITENCMNGQVQVETVCLCPSSMNLTLVNGQCV